MTTTNIKSDDVDAPIWGAEAIAREINKSVRATYHLLREGRLPVNKVGAMHVTTRRKLRALFDGE
jgi:hypothetical protein